MTKSSVRILCNQRVELLLCSSLHVVVIQFRNDLVLHDNSSVDDDGLNVSAGSIQDDGLNRVNDLPNGWIIKGDDDYVRFCARFQTPKVVASKRPRAPNGCGIIHVGG